MVARRGRRRGCEGGDLSRPGRREEEGLPAGEVPRRFREGVPVADKRGAGLPLWKELRRHPAQLRLEAEVEHAVRLVIDYKLSNVN